MTNYMNEPEDCGGEDDAPDRDAHPGGIGCGAIPIAVGSAPLLPSGGLIGSGAPISPNGEEPLPWNAVR
jgi:hypothetical protein